MTRKRPGAVEMRMSQDRNEADFRVHGAPLPMSGCGIGWSLEAGRWVTFEDGTTERCTVDLAIRLFVAAASCGRSIERRREICDIACDCFIAAQLNAMDGKRGRPKGSKKKNDPEQEAVDRAKLAAGPYAGARMAVLDGLAGSLKTGDEIDRAIRRIGNKAKRSYT